MQETTISLLNELKLLYYEILNGYSHDTESFLYIKHFTEKESYLLLVKRQELSDYYKSQNVPTEQEVLINAINGGTWSKEKEDKILEIKYCISDNEKIIVGIIPEQRGFLEHILREKRKELSDIIYERKSSLGKCIEDIIDEDVSDYMCYISCFRDEKLTNSIAKTYEDYLELETEELLKVSQSLNRVYGKFSEEKIKCIACMPFFINKLSYCKDNVQAFLGKPIWEFSHHQINLLSLGIRNLNTLQGAKGYPPDINLDATPHQLASWYDIQHGIQQIRNK